MEKRLESSGDLLKASEHTPIVLKQTKQALNCMACFVQLLVIETLDSPGLFRRNDAGRTLLYDVRHDGISVIPCVRSERSIAFMLS